MFKAMLLLAGALGVSLAFGQTHGIAVPVPHDPLELVTGEIQTLQGPDRDKALDLLARSRRYYALRAERKGYRLKVSFHVDSGGATQYDGDWEMEETSFPQMGLRWSAKTAGYSTTQITGNGPAFGEGAGDHFPIRLHAARAALFGPLPTPIDRDLRSASVTYNDVSLTCVLSGGAEHVPTQAPGRRWDENEDCIDPQSGQVYVHSVVPGSYDLFDYQDAPKLGNRGLPRNVTVTEGGKTVMRLHVDSLTEIAEADAKFFAATPEMTWGTTMASLQKMVLFPQKGSIPPDATIRPVCVFGLVTADGKLVELHSLQTGDPNSQAALDYAKTLTLPAPPGKSEHFVILIEKFVAGRK
ncbi:MAG TPA: hypothetical protein VHW09_08730 [Bryobacteraceae bacterium]|jgi:hypothetical protein|nr:hypothetical protein [Bryobacteraceae bacterium]